MNAKLLLMLLLLLPFSLSTSAVNRRAKGKYENMKVREHVMRRSPFNPTIQVNEVNNYLLLTFQYSLNDADIIISDRNGNEVVKEQQTIIHEGRTISIPETDGYPYSVEITSPTVDIQGEITLE